MNSGLENIMQSRLLEVLPELKSNSVILARFGDAPSSVVQRFIEVIKKLVAELKAPPVLIIPVRDDMNIEVLDEARMREYGWVRIEKLEEKIT